jgi:hypothetical protein
MHAQPQPHPIHASVPDLIFPGLMPIRFGIKPYIELCQSFDAALKGLEARYPSKRPVLTLATRSKLVRRNPK